MDRYVLLTSIHDISTYHLGQIIYFGTIEIQAFIGVSDCFVEVILPYASFRLDELILIDAELQTRLLSCP